MMKFLFIILVTTCQVAKAQFLQITLSGSNSDTKNNNWAIADSAWKNLSKIISVISENDPIKMAIEKESIGRKYIDAGVKFWHDFPGDNRKYKWLFECGYFAPEFWENIEKGAQVSAKDIFYSFPINWELLNKWKSQKKLFVASYLADPTVKSLDKQIFLGQELYMEIMHSRNEIYRGDKDGFLSRVNDLFGSTCSEIGEGGSFGRTKRFVEPLFSGSINYGITLDDLSNIIEKYTNNSNKEIRHWATQKMALLNLRKDPFLLNYHSIRGEKIDLENYKGKIVLLDFWNTYCTSCISRMPFLKKMFEKYKDQGFEVISICLDPETRIKEVIKIEARIKAEWPIILIGGKDEKEKASGLSLSSKIWDKYGFLSVPQLFLINKEGKLEVLNGPLLYGSFESILQNMLYK